MNDNDLGTIVFLEHYGDFSYSELEESLEHSGVKGMHWGVRNESKGGGRQNGSKKNKPQSHKQAVQAVKSTNKTANDIIRESRRAETPAARKAAADKYKKEILDKVSTPEFKRTFKEANRITKGDMAIQILGLGPFAAITIPAMKSAQKNDSQYNYEVDTAHEILREMRRP